MENQTDENINNKIEKEINYYDVKYLIVKNNRNKYFLFEPAYEHKIRSIKINKDDNEEEIISKLDKSSKEYDVCRNDNNLNPQVGVEIVEDNDALKHPEHNKRFWNAVENIKKKIKEYNPDLKKAVTVGTLALGLIGSSSMFSLSQQDFNKAALDFYNSGNSYASRYVYSYTAPDTNQKSIINTPTLVTSVDTDLNTVIKLFNKKLTNDSRFYTATGTPETDFKEAYKRYNKSRTKISFIDNSEYQENVINYLDPVYDSDDVYIMENMFHEHDGKTFINQLSFNLSIDTSNQLQEYVNKVSNDEIEPILDVYSQEDEMYLIADNLPIKKPKKENKIENIESILNKVDVEIEKDDIIENNIKNKNDTVNDTGEDAENASIDNNSIKDNSDIIESNDIIIENEDNVIKDNIDVVENNENVPDKGDTVIKNDGDVLQKEINEVDSNKPKEIISDSTVTSDIKINKQQLGTLPNIQGSESHILEKGKNSKTNDERYSVNNEIDEQKYRTSFNYELPSTVNFPQRKMVEQIKELKNLMEEIRKNEEGFYEKGELFAKENLLDKDNKTLIQECGIKTRNAIVTITEAKFKEEHPSLHKLIENNTIEEVAKRGNIEDAIKVAKLVNSYYVSYNSNLDFMDNILEMSLKDSIRNNKLVDNYVAADANLTSSHLKPMISEKEPHVELISKELEKQKAINEKLLKEIEKLKSNNLDNENANNIINESEQLEEKEQGYKNILIPNFVIMTDKGLKSYTDCIIENYDQNTKECTIRTADDKFLKVPQDTIDRLYKNEQMYNQVVEEQKKEDIAVAKGLGIVFQDLEHGIEGTHLPDFSLIDEQRSGGVLKTFSNFVVHGYNTEDESYVVSNGNTDIVLKSEELEEIVTSERLKKTTQDSPKYEKLLQTQYEDFFKQRDNTAPNFIHNFEVYCRKEANSPLDSIKVAKEIISRMDKKEQQKTKSILNEMKDKNQTITEALVDIYNHAVSVVPLNENYIEKTYPDKILPRQYYDTIYTTGELVGNFEDLRRRNKLDPSKNEDKNLKIGDTIKNISIPVDKTFGKGKQSVFFEELTVVSASKDNNSITLKNKDKSLIEVPRDKFLEIHREVKKKELQKEIKMEAKMHKPKKDFSIEMA